MKFNFERFDFDQTDRAAEKVAVVADRSLTWGQLKDESDQLLSALEGSGLKPGHPVIVHGHKEASMVVSIVACMRGGFPYVPIDVSAPAKRRQQIEDLVTAPMRIECSPPVARCVPLEQEEPSRLWRADDPLTYILFTSGSTGVPKGVQISRQAVRSFVNWLSRDFGLQGEDEIFVNQALFSFDLSHYELMGFLNLGGSIVLCDQNVCKDAEKLIAHLIPLGCTTWVSTPSFATLALQNRKFDQEFLRSLKLFLFCGEILQPGTVRQLRQRFPRSRVLNTYGPTEATVATTLIEIDDDCLKKYSVLPVGYPKPDTSITIESVGAEPGEIIIAGENVSVGYLGDRALTEEKFCIKDGRRAYRTGDLGKIEDGALFFYGRTDDQIKLHGYRIELGEIDGRLSRFPQVMDCMTIAPQKDGKVVRLVSFVKLEREASISEDLVAEMKEALALDLPSYMIPSDIRAIGEFPYSSNHKIDRQKLTKMFLEGEV